MDKLKLRDSAIYAGDKDVAGDAADLDESCAESDYTNDTLLEVDRDELGSTDELESQDGDEDENEFFTASESSCFGSMESFEDCGFAESRQSLLERKLRRVLVASAERLRCSISGLPMS